MSARTLRGQVHEALRFGLVGGLGFVVDGGLLALFTLGLDLSPVIWRFVSFLTAVTVTWALHRSFTFRGGRRAPAKAQWLKAVIFNGGGALIGLGIYFLCLFHAPAPWNEPMAALVISAGIAFVFNFLTSKLFVFGVPRGVGNVSGE